MSIAQQSPAQEATVLIEEAVSALLQAVIVLEAVLTIALSST